MPWYFGFYVKDSPLILFYVFSFSSFYLSLPVLAAAPDSTSFIYIPLYYYYYFLTCPILYTFLIVYYTHTTFSIYKSPRSYCSLTGAYNSIILIVTVLYFVVLVCIFYIPSIGFFLIFFCSFFPINYLSSLQLQTYITFTTHFFGVTTFSFLITPLFSTSILLYRVFILHIYNASYILYMIVTQLITYTSIPLIITSLSSRACFFAP